MMNKMILHWKITQECKKMSRLKGIIRPFELKEIFIFYYLIEAAEFSDSNDMH